MGKCDVVIIGAGPAGLKAAQVVAKAGKRVVVLEKSAKLGNKVCAGGLARRTIKSFSVPAHLLEKTFNYVVFTSGSKQTKMEDDDTIVGMVDREELAKWLAQGAEAQGAQILLNHKATEIAENHVIAQGKKFTFDYLVGADGSNSLVRRFLKLKTAVINLTFQIKVKEKLAHLEWHYNFDRFGSGYGWIFPHQDYTALGCGCRPDQIGPRQLRENFVAWLKKLTMSINEKAISTTLINLDYRGLKFGGYFLVGDAAGLASPFTGEGIYSALVSGEEAARALINPDYSLNGLRQLLRWRKTHLLLAQLFRLGPLPCKTVHYLLPYLARIKKIRQLYFSLTVS